ncbi:hypothetical protein L207DRAFT_638184 [Hyaloscypha variabilis F]|uniref:Uncharacterized protein n=1 Tax=Hyaloscypha variabilis (strain UAMH 11265 / GT02V1 / F) TaxID=1149755 RepID=A0A2J6R837_HYAVF|nr:hypothetical protein L207DRAFT_638184 [Hyaloscypha variabilis F]
MELEVSRDSTSLSDIESHAAPSQDCMLQNHGDLSDTHICKGVDSLINVFLDRRFRVTGFLRRDNHAEVYSILCVPSPSECFEARAYDLGGLSPKLRQYRLRSIKRLSKRTVLEALWGGRTVIVYKAGTEMIQGKETSEHKEPLPSELPPRDGLPRFVENTEVKRQIKTTDRQQEMARIRQLERRQSKRRSKRQMDPSRNLREETAKGYKTEVDSPRETAEEEALYVLLYIAHSDELHLRDQLPAATRLSLERYLQKSDLNFEDDNEMEAFMKTKHHELLFLRRQQKKLPALLKRRHDEFEQILRAPPPYPVRAPPPYPSNFEHQQSVKMAQHRYKVIKNVSDILPKLIHEVDTVHRELRKRLTLARQKKQEVENLIAIGVERKRLTRQVAAYGKCSRAVFPTSMSYAQVVVQYAAAEKELNDFERRHATSSALLDSLAEYKKLIGSSGKESALSTQAPVDEFIRGFEQLDVVLRCLVDC